MVEIIEIELTEEEKEKTIEEIKAVLIQICKKYLEEAKKC